MYDKRVKRNRKLYQHLSIAVQDAAKQFVTLIPASELAFSRNQIEHASEKQNEALEALGLGEKRDSSLFHLSEGQKKMVQLISMLSLELDFLMLDEPFSGLDQRACEYFMNWIKLKSPAQNFLIISHRLSPLAGVSHHHAVIENQTLWRGER